MSQLETIRAAIVAQMQTVPDIGRVHGWERFDKESRALHKHYITTVAGEPRIRGWYVHRLSEQRRRIGTGKADVLITWQVRGFMGLADADQSEITFDALIDALVAAFWGNQNLGINGLTTAVDGEAGLQLQDSGPSLFGGAFCHSARLVLHTRHTE